MNKIVVLHLVELNSRRYEAVVLTSSSLLASHTLLGQWALVSSSRGRQGRDDGSSDKVVEIVLLHSKKKSSIGLLTRFPAFVPLSAPLWGDDKNPMKKVPKIPYLPSVRGNPKPSHTNPFFLVNPRGSDRLHV